MHQNCNQDLRAADVFASAKAVSEGALIWHLESLVVARVARETYGFTHTPLFNRSDPAHQARRNAMFEHHNGKRYLPGGFSILVEKASSFSFPV